LLVTLLFRQDEPNAMFVGAPVAAGLTSLLLSRRVGWWASYAANGRAAVAGAAVAAASVAAIVDPSEHDSNLIVFTFGAALFVGSLAAAGVVAATPGAWAWARWRRFAPTR
jgi:hypothetical protein